MQFYGFFLTCVMFDVRHSPTLKMELRYPCIRIETRRPYACPACAGRPLPCTGRIGSNSSLGLAMTDND